MKQRDKTHRNETMFRAWRHWRTQHGLNVKCRAKHTALKKRSAYLGNEGSDFENFNHADDEVSHNFKVGAANARRTINDEDDVHDWSGRALREVERRRLRMNVRFIPPVIAGCILEMSWAHIFLTRTDPYHTHCNKLVPQPVPVTPT